MNKIYTPVLVFVFKMILGITFVLASFPKIEDPASFARILYGYGVFPDMSINLIAVILPIMELLAGFSLIMRFFPRSALIIINAMLALFIFLIGFNLFRGHPFDCGCFSVAGMSGVKAAILALIRDIILLAAGIYVLKNMNTHNIRKYKTFA